MKNVIENGVEYAVNLKGERYEVRIPGTKCPVSVGVLEQWYWNEGICCREIADKIKNIHSVAVSDRAISRWMKANGINIKPWRVYFKSRDKATKSIRASEKHIARITSKENIDRLRKALQGYYSTDRGKKAREKTLIKARQARAQSRKTATSVPCHYCGKEVTRCAKHIERYTHVYCSTSCRGQGRSVPSAKKGVYCPSCRLERLRVSRWGPKYIQFQCGSCGKGTTRPIIELGLRQDLEAAGALDDGRILASAFKTKAEMEQETQGAIPPPATT